MADDQGWRWTEDPILPGLPPPPPGLILVRGATPIRIYDTPERVHIVGGKRRPDGGRDGVVIAWAGIPRGGWAVLLAWTSYARVGLHQTALARWGWCRLDEARVKPLPPPPAREGACRYGWYEGCELDKAVATAAAALPEHLREAAITPAERQGPE